MGIIVRRHAYYTTLAYNRGRVKFTQDPDYNKRLLQTVLLRYGTNTHYYLRLQMRRQFPAAYAEYRYSGKFIPFDVYPDNPPLASHPGATACHRRNRGRSTL